MHLEEAFVLVLMFGNTTPSSNYWYATWIQSLADMKSISKCIQTNLKKLPIDVSEHSWHCQSHCLAFVCSVHHHIPCHRNMGIIMMPCIWQMHYILIVHAGSFKYSHAQMQGCTARRASDFARCRVYLLFHLDCNGRVAVEAHEWVGPGSDHHFVWMVQGRSNCSFQACSNIGWQHSAWHRHLSPN